MKVTGLRMYGVNDLRVETFDLRDMTDDEIPAKIYTDSLCMSSYKAAIQSSKHKRVPDGLDKNPVILGHEFAGMIANRGKTGSMNGKWARDLPSNRLWECPETRARRGIRLRISAAT